MQAGLAAQAQFYRATSPGGRERQSMRRLNKRLPAACASTLNRTASA
jgi:hypothetical protein